MGGSSLHSLEMELWGGQDPEADASASGSTGTCKTWGGGGGVRSPKQMAGEPVLPVKPTVPGPRDQNRTDLGLRVFPRAPCNPLLARDQEDYSQRSPLQIKV